MARKTDPNQAVTNAVLAQKLDTLTAHAAEIVKSMDQGFHRVHERQDTTNGKVLNANDEIKDLKAKFQYNRIIWYLFTTAITVIVALASYIVLK